MALIRLPLLCESLRFFNLGWGKECCGSISEFNRGLNAVVRCQTEPHMCADVVSWNAFPSPVLEP